jgi:hypothetical protein
VAYPVLNLSLLRIPTFRIGVIGGSIFRTGIGAIPFLLPLMLQLGFGLDALQSGMITFASAAGALIMKTLAKTILARSAFRNVLTVNALFGAAFLAASGLFTPTDAALADADRSCWSAAASARCSSPASTH